MFARFSILSAAALAVAVLALVFAWGHSFSPSANAVNGSLVNTTGQAASYLRLSATFNINGTISSQPAACPAPDVFVGFEFVEFIWSTACIGPGDKVVVDLNFDPSELVFGSLFLATPPVLLAVNGTGGVASQLHISLEGLLSFAGALVIDNAPGCAEPALAVKSPVLLNVVWPEGCVDPGETVAVHIAATAGPTTTLPYSWTLVGPLPTPGSVGGVSFSAPSAGRGADGAVDTTTVIVLGLAAGSVALTTAAWHVRRRLR